MSSFTKSIKKWLIKQLKPSFWQVSLYFM